MTILLYILCVIVGIIVVVAFDTLILVIFQLIVDKIDDISEKKFFKKINDKNKNKK